MLTVSNDSVKKFIFPEAQPARRGEWFLFSYYLSQLEVTILEIIHNELQKSVKTQEEPLDEEWKEFLENELSDDENNK